MKSEIPVVVRMVVISSQLLLVTEISNEHHLQLEMSMILTTIAFLLWFFHALLGALSLLLLIPVLLNSRLTNQHSTPAYFFLTHKHTDASFSGLPVLGFLSTDNDDNVLGGKRFVPKKCSSIGRCTLAQ